MKILVIDDSSIHQDAARKQLADEHDLTVVGNYDDAQFLLGGGDRYGGKKTGSHGFEVVLCDLLMPASGQMQGKDGARLVGQVMPVGIFLALLAAKNGAKHVAVFTDSNHHQHPASACFDSFNPEESKPAVFTVGTAKMILCNAGNWVQSDMSVQPEVVHKKRSDGSEYSYEVYPQLKRWDLLLEYGLLNPPAPEEVSIA